MHPFIATVFLASDGHYLQDNTARIVKERFVEHEGKSNISFYKEKKSCCCGFLDCLWWLFFTYFVDGGV